MKKFKKLKDRITLQEHFNEKIYALKTAINIRLLANETATDLKVTAVEKAAELKNKVTEVSTTLAAQILEKRLDSMNDFRQALTTQSSTFLTRTEFEMQYKGVVEDIKILREAKAQLEGKASTASVNISYLISIIGIIVALAAILLA